MPVIGSETTAAKLSIPICILADYMKFCDTLVVMNSKIILLNGASSAGKSTLAQALQDQLEQPFLQFSLDFFMFNSKVLPKRRDSSGTFSWLEMRPKLFAGYYQCLAALAQAGNNLVIDTIVENQAQLEQLVLHLEPFDVFYVGVHCPLPELERRELQRADRRIGDAKMDFETVHTFSNYDFEVDSSLPADFNAEKIIEAWKTREPNRNFAKLTRNTSTTT